MSPVFLLVGLALGAAGVAVAVTRPRLLLAAMVVMDVTNLTGVIEENVGISPFRPLMALALISILVLARQGRLVLRGSPVILSLMVLLGCMWVNAALSTVPVTSSAAAMAFTINLIYFAIVYVLLCSLRSWAEVLAAATVGLAILAAVGVGHELLLGGEGDLFGLSRVDIVQEGSVLIPRHSGTVEDVNFWGRLLLLYLPPAFSFAALAGRAGSYARVVGWLLAAGSLTAGIYLTQSRGAFLALPVAVLVWVLLAGWHARRALIWLPVLFIVLLTVTGAWERLSGLTAFLAGGPAASADLSLNNRARLMQNAVRMFQDSPWIGQGIGSYPERVAEFDRYSNTPEPMEVAGAAHNFYLEQAADGGLMLLAAWLLVAVAVGFVCWRSLRLLRITEATSRYVVVGAAAGLVAWLAASLFLHMSNLRALLVVFAVLAAVDQYARSQAALTGARPAPAHPRMAIAGALGVSSAALILVGGLGLIANVWAAPYRSTAHLTVGIPEGTGDYAAYQLDLISRGMVVPSFATALQHKYEAEPPVPYPATFSPSRDGGAVVVAVSTDTEEQARTATAETITWAKEQVAALQTPYVVRPGPTVTTPREASSWRRWLLLTLGVFCGVGATVLYRREKARETEAEDQQIPVNA